MEIFGNLKAKENLQATLNVGGVGGGSASDFDEKIIPYDNRITQNTNNINTLNSRVSTNEDAIESISDRVGSCEDNISYLEDDLSFLEGAKADKTEIPNVPTWAMQEEKPNYNSNEIANSSNVEGSTTSNALNNLNTHINAISDEVDENIQSISNLNTSVNNVNQTVQKNSNDITNLQKNNLDNPVSLDGYSSENMYICPNDGYIYVQNGAIAIVRPNNSILGSNYLGVTSQSGTSNWNCLFVKKGFKVYPYNNVGICRYLELI